MDRPELSLCLASAAPLQLLRHPGRSACFTTGVCGVSAALDQPSCAQFPALMARPSITGTE